jgi:hypothetical protein
MASDTRPILGVMMPFLPYQLWQSESGSLTFRRVKQVALGGKSGPIAAYVTGE